MAVGTPTLDESVQKFLLTLLDTPAPSGFESAAGDVFIEYASTFADVERDKVGNCYATVNKGAKKRIAVFGHLDEIGFVITGVNDEGLLKFDEIGGWDAAVAVGQRVRVVSQNNEHVGIIGRAATHQLRASDATEELTVKQLWIDIGAVDRDDAEQYIRPGDHAVIDSTPHMYENGRLMSRSLDNRIGCFVALEVARRCVGLNVEVVAIGTVSEETTQFGAVAAGYNTEPDAACVVDVTYTSDIPGEHDEEVVLGGGPVIVFGSSARSSVGKRLLDVARIADIEFQLNGSGSATGTDADALTLAGKGVLAGAVCIPTRYLHMPGELLDLADVEATIGLLTAWIAQDQE